MVGPIQPKATVAAVVTPDAPPQTLAQIKASVAVKQTALTTIQNDAAWAALTADQKAETLRTLFK